MVSWLRCLVSEAHRRTGRHVLYQFVVALQDGRGYSGSPGIPGHPGSPGVKGEQVSESLSSPVLSVVCCTHWVPLKRKLVKFILYCICSRLSLNRLENLPFVMSQEAPQTSPCLVFSRPLCFCFPLPKMEGAKESLQERFCGAAVNKWLNPSVTGDEWEHPRLLMI